MVRTNEAWNDLLEKGEELPMKIYNRELEEIENVELQQRISEIVGRVQEFLIKSYNLDSQMIEEKIKQLSIVKFSKKDDKTFIKTFDDKPKEIPIKAEEAAFLGQKSQEYVEDKCYFENAIFIDESYQSEKFEHVLAHEFFHFLSSDTEMTFDEIDIATYKSGISVRTYDKEDNETSSEGRWINEGITEALTLQYDGKTNEETYEGLNKFGAILISPRNTKLLEAYFSQDKSKIQNFYDDFEQRQSAVSAETLRTLPNIKFTIDENLLRGCLEYTLSNCENMEQLIEERKRLLPIFKRMQSDLSYMYGDENFDIKEMVNSVFNARRTVLTTKSTQALGKETLTEQKDTDYIDETEQIMETEERRIESTKDQSQRL